MPKHLSDDPFAAWIGLLPDVLTLMPCDVTMSRDTIDSVAPVSGRAKILNCLPSLGYISTSAQGVGRLIEFNVITDLVWTGIFFCMVLRF